MSFHERFSPSVSSGPNPIAGETCYVHLQRIASGKTLRYRANPLDFEVRKQLSPYRATGRHAVTAAAPLHLNLAVKPALPVRTDLQVHCVATRVLAELQHLAA